MVWVTIVGEIDASSSIQLDECLKEQLASISPTIDTQTIFPSLFVFICTILFKLYHHQRIIVLKWIIITKFIEVFYYFFFYFFRA